MTDSHGTAPQAEPSANGAADAALPPPLLPASAHVPVRPRCDGWTPQKQRDYVEMLADTGVARQAAAVVGMSEQGASRLRRRPDARAFDLACEAAMRFGAHRLRSVAWERAIEGTIKQHFYHGELKGEERVYDNRLLISLLGRLDRVLEPRAEAAAVAESWEPWMAAIEAGRPPPVPEEPPSWKAEDDEAVWRDDDGVLWTVFPPPPDFEGEEQGTYADGKWYQRTLTPAERAVIDGDADRARDSEREDGRTRRDRYFGFRP